MFPATSVRRFSPSWTTNRPWLRYSLLNAKAYCLPCLCFTETESPLLQLGLTSGRKLLAQKSSLLEKHNASEVHKLAEEKAFLFIRNQQQPGSDIASMMARETKLEQIRTNRNAKYTSPMFQNTIISLCENAIQEKVLAMFSSSYWSLMADETEDVSNMEQVSVCARFVHNYEVYEEFLRCVAVAKIDAQTIADALLSTLKQWGANLAFLVSHGYDGASVVSSSKNGVQAKIVKVFPNTTYVHCRSHVLNLVISSSYTSVPSVCNLFTQVDALTWFLTGSAKMVYGDNRIRFLKALHS